MPIIRVGRHAVSVEAEEKTIERSLGVKTSGRNGLVTKARPSSGALSGLVDNVEIVPAPELYAPASRR